MTVRMTAPDGSIVAFPDGTSRQEVMDALRSLRMRGAQRASTASPRTITASSAPGSSQIDGLRGYIKVSETDEPITLRPSQRPEDREDPPVLRASIRALDDTPPALRGSQRPRDLPFQMRGPFRSETLADTAGAPGSLDLSRMSGYPLALETARRRLAATDDAYRAMASGQSLPWALGPIPLAMSTANLFASNPDRMRAAMQGLSLGGADEAIAWMRKLEAERAIAAGHDPGYTPQDAYDAEMEVLREARDGFSEAHPWQSLGSELVGSAPWMLTGAGEVNAARVLGVNGAKAAAVAAPVALDAISGALGANPGERLNGAVGGALLGGGVRATRERVGDLARIGVERFDADRTIRSRLERLGQDIPVATDFLEGTADRLTEAGALRTAENAIQVGRAAAEKLRSLMNAKSQAAEPGR